MIGRIRGEVLEASNGIVVVDAGGIGYEVIVPESVMVQMPAVGERADLLIRQIFREDSAAMYGFLQPFQRRLFDLLLSVGGCGPKIGLALIGQLGEDTVAGAILAQDTRTLARATGVGAKLAERIVLELKEKIAEESFLRKIESSRKPIAKKEDPLVDALVALGYRRPEAESAAESARDQGETVEEQLRAALRSLAK